jgi:hypothetical protein
MTAVMKRFLIKGSRRYNLRHNKERSQSPEFGKMINGQGLGLVAKFRYGICPMSFNGCEVIAVHNALVYLKKPRPLAEIAYYMERFRVLMGFFGCNAYSIGKALRYFGAENVRSRNADGSQAFIITFWTKRPFLSEIHTVFCVRTDHGIAVYNRYNNCPTVRFCNTVEEIAGKRRPIAVYNLLNPDEISI